MKKYRIKTKYGVSAYTDKDGYYEAYGVSKDSDSEPKFYVLFDDTDEFNVVVPGTTVYKSDCEEIIPVV